MNIITMRSSFKLISLLFVVFYFHCEEVIASPVVHQSDGFGLDSNKIIRALKLQSMFSGKDVNSQSLFAKEADGVFHSQIPQELDQTMNKLRHALSPEVRRFMSMETRMGDRKMAPPLREDPDAKRDVVQLVSSLGYPVQKYTVQTQDGYLLTLHRVPYGRKDKGIIKSNTGTSNNENKNTTRPSIFLQHGLLSSAADWVMNYANDSLALILADHGYDVWLGNSRGNTYSMGHVSLKPEDDKFWDFTFDEMAKYDMPAFIDFILNKTGEKSLYYVGHSQGTIMAFAGFSSLPEYQKKIRLFVGMAPIISLNHIVSPIKYLSLLTDQEMYFVFGRKSFMTNNFLIKFFADKFCDKTVTNWVCSNIVFLLAGYDTSNLNTTRLTVYMNHTPAGTSVKNMIHYAQFIRSKTFTMYDYDSPSENMKHYNQTTPPAYNPSLFKIPSLLYTATKDWLADPEDVQVLESTIPKVVGKLNIPVWNHLDFVWGMDAADKCYNHLLKELPKY